MNRKITFGDLRIGPTARRYIERALSKNWISEGENVQEFESAFASRFGWKHAIATSSGTDAGIVVWSAIRELRELNCGEGGVVTPACAFVSTANCILAAGIKPAFADIELDTLNLSPPLIQSALDESDVDGIQFVATMGKPTPIKEIAKIADDHDLYLIGDFCEGHGARFQIDANLLTAEIGSEWTKKYDKIWDYADNYCDATIYSFYCAHLIVAGEGGMICTDDDEIADLCRSIKCHGYGPGPRFDFRVFGLNAKSNDLCAAVGLESLERFDETFSRRRVIRQKMITALEKFEDRLILYRDNPGELISPHAFPVILRNENDSIEPLYRYLQNAGIEVKTLFGSLPTQHSAFAFMGHKLREFPVAERVGRTGIHFGCHQFMTEDDLDYIAEVVEDGLKKFYGT